MMVAVNAIRQKNRHPVLLTFLCILLVIGFLLMFYETPGSRIGPEQPIPFSHRLHAGIKDIHCEYCHPYVGYSRHPGLPPVEKCLHCHNYIIANHFWIQKEHQYFNTHTQVPWKKAFYLAKHVLFNHQRHIQKQIECRKCHDNIETFDRIKGKTFHMDFCITCHREKQANVDCWLACHS
jgi:hypothetical protein